jgi:hypothetical protein
VEKRRSNFFVFLSSLRVWQLLTWTSLKMFIRISDWSFLLRYIISFWATSFIAYCVLPYYCLPVTSDWPWDHCTDWLCHYQLWNPVSYTKFCGTLPNLALIHFLQTAIAIRDLETTLAPLCRCTVLKRGMLTDLRIMRNLRWGFLLRRMQNKTIWRLHNVRAYIYLSVWNNPCLERERWRTGWRLWNLTSCN